MEKQGQAGQRCVLFLRKNVFHEWMIFINIIFWMNECFNEWIAVEPRNNRPTFKGLLSIKVKILGPIWSFLMWYHLSLKMNLSWRWRIFSPNGTDEAGSYCIYIVLYCMQLLLSWYNFSVKKTHNILMLLWMRYQPTSQRTQSIIEMRGRTSKWM